MKILVLNCGSTSIKYKLFNFTDSAEPKVIAQDYIENIKNQYSFDAHLKNILKELIRRKKIKYSND